jgi:large subunit ribosomal protein L37e
MVKGTPSMGKKHHITHIRCRRCGRVAYNIKTKVCAACGYGRSSKLKDYSWKTHTVTRDKRKR